MNIERFKRINAGAAQAASLALARMARVPVAVTLVRARSTSAAARPEAALRVKPVTAVSMTLKGLPGGALLCFPAASARRLSSASPANRSAAMRASFLKEVGNVICGNYVSVLANSLRSRIVPGIPRLDQGPLEPLVEGLLALAARKPEDGMVIEVEIAMKGELIAGRLFVAFSAGALVR